MRFVTVAVFSLPILLTGCAAVSPSTATSVASGVSIRGTVHGGQQPISGAQVYLFAAGTGGYGGPSVSLLTSVPGSTTLDNTAADPTYNDYYVTTGANGSFTITGDYSCTSGQQVYLYAIGGNPGSGTNSAAGLLAALGSCPGGGTFSSSTFVFMDEVSTVATAYAIAGFATDAVHVADDEGVSANATAALAKTGLANAFANVANLESLATGNALTATPSGNGTVPQQTIDTLADILAACVNSTGSGSAGCSTLFTNAKSGGSTGTTPNETATAAINIAHHPAANVPALYGNPTAVVPFAPTLASQPNDFTIGIRFTGGGISNPRQIAIDQAGNAWLANQTPDTVVEISPAAAFLSGASGFTGNGLSGPVSVAIDTQGAAWIGNRTGTTVTKLSTTGQPLSGTNGFTGGGFYDPYGIAIAASGNAWVALYGGNGMTELSATGTAVVTADHAVLVSQPTGVAIDGAGSLWFADLGSTGLLKVASNGATVSATGSGGGLTASYYVAIDANGSAWVPDSAGNAVSRFTNAMVSSAGTNGYTGGGLTTPTGASIDGAGTAWIADKGGAAIGITSAGAFVSGSTGYTGGGLSAPIYDAVDGSGNLWLSDSSGAVVELIGVAAPVITPICAGLPATPNANGSSSLGTRP